MIFHQYRDVHEKEYRLYNDSHAVTHLSHKSGPNNPSQSSRTRNGSSPPCKCRCLDTGCSGTALEVPSNRTASPPQPSGPPLSAGCLCSGRPWTDPARSPHSRSSAARSRPPWGRSAQRDPLAGLPGRVCHPSPGSRSHREHCREYGSSWPRWCLWGNHRSGFNLVNVMPTF